MTIPRPVLTAEQEAYVQRVEADWGQKVIALAIPMKGEELDGIFTWETAQSMALNEGASILVLEGDAHLSREELQALCDREKDIHDDCWGVTHPDPPAIETKKAVSDEWNKPPVTAGKRAGR